MTQAELARMYGVSAQAVNGWKAAGAPFGVDGKISPAEFRRWEIAATQARAEAKATPTSEDDARARKLAAEAEIKEAELAKLRGQIVTVGDAAAEYERRLVPLRAAISAVPGLYAPKVVGLDTVADGMRVLRGLAADLLRTLGGDP